MVRSLLLVLILPMSVPLFAEDWTGKAILPKKPSQDILFYELVNGEPVSKQPHNLMNCKVREEHENTLRVFDGHREGWVSKDDFLLAECATAFWIQQCKRNPDNTDALFMRGICHSRNGAHDLAIADFEECLRREPQSAVFLICRGNAAIRKGDVDLAIEYYDEAIEIDVKNAGAFNCRGYAWLNKKEFGKAMSDFEAAIKLDPADPSLLTGRAAVHVAKKDYALAIFDYCAAIRLDPNDPEIYESRGHAWGQKGEYGLAAADYTEAIRLVPNDVNAYLMRAYAFGRMREYDKAIADYSQAIKLDPKSASHYCARGQVWLSKCDTGKAIADFDEALRLDPENDETLRAMTWLYAACDDAKYRDGKKAVEYAKRVLDADAKSWRNHTLFAAACAENGDFENAVRSLVNAQKLLIADTNCSDYDLRGVATMLEQFKSKQPYRMN